MSYATFSCWCIFWMFLAKCADGSVIISSSASSVPEGSSLTLTCTYTGNDQVRGVQWINNGNNTRRKYDISIKQSNPCSIQGVPGLNETLFTYTCFTLTVFNVTRNNKGDNFTCTANTVSGSTWGNIKSDNCVIVNVSGADGSVIISSSALSVSEGSSLTLNCTYTGNDQVRGIQWVNNGNNTGRKYDIAIEQSKPCSISRIPGLNETFFTYTCFTLTVLNVTRKNQSDNFTCAAITNVTINSENSVIVNVSVPISSVELTSPKEIYVAMIAGELRNFRCCTSGGRPKPTVEWYKTSGNNCTRNGIRITTNMSSLLSSNNGLKEVESSLDFYASSSDNNLWICCAASNVNSEWKLSQSKKLEIKHVPQCPTGLKASSTKSSSVTVEWVSHFNGGLKQTFVILYKTIESSEYLVLTEDELDKKTKNTQTITGLKDGSTYDIIIFSRNAIGNCGQNSSIQFETEVLVDDPPPSYSTPIGGLAGGIPAVCVLVVVVVIVVVLRKRRSYVKREIRHALTQGQKQQSLNAVDEDSDDIPNEVENPMYDGFKCSAARQDPPDVLYTLPKKKGDDVYTVVVKKTKRPRNSQDNTQQKMKGNEIARLSVHEINESPQQTKKKNFNPDGVVYADTVFANPPKGQNPLGTHGGGDTTVYADVDLTKKAKPLPESDEEDGVKRETIQQ